VETDTSEVARAHTHAFCEFLDTLSLAQILNHPNLPAREEDVMLLLASKACDYIGLPAGSNEKHDQHSRDLERGPMSVILFHKRQRQINASSNPR